MVWAYSHRLGSIAVLLVLAGGVLIGCDRPPGETAGSDPSAAGAHHHQPPAGQDQAVSKPAEPQDADIETDNDPHIPPVEDQGPVSSVLKTTEEPAPTYRPPEHEQAGPGPGSAEDDALQVEPLSQEQASSLPTEARKQDHEQVRSVLDVQNHEQVRSVLDVQDHEQVCSMLGVPEFFPLRDAAAGEWVEMATLDEQILRYQIVSVTPAFVRTQVGIRAHGKPVGMPAVREDFRENDPLARQAKTCKAVRQCTPATIEAAGRTWDSLLYEDRWIDENIHYVRCTWVSEEALVFGILRMELTGDDELEAKLELTAFGKRTRDNGQ